MESTWPLLSLMVALPLVGALLLWLVRPLARCGRSIGMAFALATLGLAAYAVAMYDVAAFAPVQLAETYAWIPQIGVSWALGVNGLGLAMVVLAAVLVPVVMLAAWNDFAGDDEQAARRRTGFVALTLALESFIVLIFTAQDVFLFYLAFEAMLVPGYFLVGNYGGPRRRYAALKFLLVSLFGGLVMLGGVVALGVMGPGGEHAFLLSTLTAAPVTGTAARWIFLTFFLAFAIKAPMVPVHTWLPDTAEQAHPGVSAILVGILDKIGTYGMIVLCLPLFPEASRWAAPVIIVLALVSVIYGAIMAIGQKDLMRLVSYTSISHFGFIVLGIYVGNTAALTGAMLYMVAHGLSIAIMFLLTGFLTRRAGTQKIEDYRGMQRVTPVLAGLWLFGGLASIALPGLSGFVPEYLVLMGTLSTQLWAGVVAMGGVVLSALYILWPYQKVFTGPKEEAKVGTKLSDLRGIEIAAIAPLVVLIAWVGVQPNHTIRYLEPVTEHVSVHLTDDSVAVNAQEGTNQ